MEYIFTDGVFLTLIVAVMVGMVAGFIDAIAGGGGLITVPVLLLLNLPPLEALATNKLQGSFGTLSASITMICKKRIDLGRMKFDILFCGIGASIGAVLLQLSSVGWLEFLIPAIVLIIGVYFLFAPNIGQTVTEPKISKRTWRFFWLPGMGFYDGYLGPGAGMFYTLGNVALRGKEIISATANAKILNFTSNIASLAVFILGGKIIWSIGIAMALGQIIGSSFGAKMMIKGGIKLIKPFIVIICFIMLIKFSFDKF